MTNKIIDGKKVAKSIKEKVKNEILNIGETIRLAVFLCTDDPASSVYVNKKIQACSEVGIESIVVKPFENSDVSSLPCPTNQLLDRISKFNENDQIHGILVQMPLPPEIDAQKVLDAIDPRKDVDAFSSILVGKLSKGNPSLIPCTPAGIKELLLQYNIKTDGAKITVINRSNVVGRPLVSLMTQDSIGANSTCVLCHDHTPPDLLKRECLTSDIVVVAVGIPDFLTEDMIKDGATVIDVGINRIPNSKKIVGDVHKKVYEKAGMYTPVPGGIGPMTVAMLLNNTLEAFKNQK